MSEIPFDPSQFTQKVQAKAEALLPVDVPTPQPEAGGAWKSEFGATRAERIEKLKESVIASKIQFRDEGGYKDKVSSGAFGKFVDHVPLFGVNDPQFFKGPSGESTEKTIVNIVPLEDYGRKRIYVDGHARGAEDIGIIKPKKAGFQEVQSKWGEPVVAITYNLLADKVDKFGTPGTMHGVIIMKEDVALRLGLELKEDPTLLFDAIEAANGPIQLATGEMQELKSNKGITILANAEKYGGSRRENVNTKPFPENFKPFAKDGAESSIGDSGLDFDDLINEEVQSKAHELYDAEMVRLNGLYDLATGSESWDLAGRYYDDIKSLQGKSWLDYIDEAEQKLEEEKISKLSETDLGKDAGEKEKDASQLLTDAMKVYEDLEGKVKYLEQAQNTMELNVWVRSPEWKKAKEIKEKMDKIGEVFEKRFGYSGLYRDSMYDDLGTPGNHGKLVDKTDELAALAKVNFLRKGAVNDTILEKWYNETARIYGKQPKVTFLEFKTRFNDGGVSPNKDDRNNVDDIKQVLTDIGGGEGSNDNLAWIRDFVEKQNEDRNLGEQENFTYEGLIFDSPQALLSAVGGDITLVEAKSLVGVHLMNELQFQHAFKKAGIPGDRLIPITNAIRNYRKENGLVFAMDEKQLTDFFGLMTSATKNKLLGSDLADISMIGGLISDGDLPEKYRKTLGDAIQARIQKDLADKENDDGLSLSVDGPAADSLSRRKTISETDTSSKLFHKILPESFLAVGLGIKDKLKRKKAATPAEKKNMEDLGQEIETWITNFRKLDKQVSPVQPKDVREWGAIAARIATDFVPELGFAMMAANLGGMALRERATWNKIAEAKKDKSWWVKFGAYVDQTVIGRIANDKDSKLSKEQRLKALGLGAVTSVAGLVVGEMASSAVRVPGLHGVARMASARFFTQVVVPRVLDLSLESRFGKTKTEAEKKEWVDLVIGSSSLTTTVATSLMTGYILDQQDINVSDVINKFTNADVVQTAGDAVDDAVQKMDANQAAKNTETREVLGGLFDKTKEAIGQVDLSNAGNTINEYLDNLDERVAANKEVQERETKEIMDNFYDKIREVTGQVDLSKAPDALKENGLNGVGEAASTAWNETSAAVEDLASQLTKPEPLATDSVKPSDNGSEASQPLNADQQTAANEATQTPEPQTVLGEAKDEIQAKDGSGSYKIDGNGNVVAVNSENYGWLQFDPNAKVGGEAWNQYQLANAHKLDLENYSVDRLINEAHLAAAGKIDITDAAAMRSVTEDSLDRIDSSSTYSSPNLEDTVAGRQFDTDGDGKPDSWWIKDPKTGEDVAGRLENSDTLYLDGYGGTEGAFQGVLHDINPYLSPDQVAQISNKVVTEQGLTMDKVGWDPDNPAAMDPKVIDAVNAEIAKYSVQDYIMSKFDLSPTVANELISKMNIINAHDGTISKNPAELSIESLTVRISVDGKEPVSYLNFPWEKWIEDQGISIIK